MDLKETQTFNSDISSHWYYVLKGAMVKRAIKGIPSLTRLADIGAGSGFFSKYLLQHTKIQSGVCIDTGYKNTHEEKVGEKSLSFIQKSSVEDCDLLLFMDVLEHIDQDDQFLSEYVKQSKSGSWFFITVPAFPFLYSSHDRYLGHYRRYTKQSLKKLVENQGLKIHQLNYFYSTLFPLMASKRLLDKGIGGIFKNKEDKSDMTAAPFLVNALLKGIHLPELIALNLPRPFGLTLWCLAERQ